MLNFREKQQNLSPHTLQAQLKIVQHIVQTYCATTICDIAQYLFSSWQQLGHINCYNIDEDGFVSYNKG